MPTLVWPVFGRGMARRLVAPDGVACRLIVRLLTVVARRGRLEAGRRGRCHPGTRQSASMMSPAVSSAAFRAMSGSTEVQVSAVSTMLEWPSMSCTTFRSVPAEKLVESNVQTPLSSSAQRTTVVASPPRRCAFWLCLPHHSGASCNRTGWIVVLLDASGRWQRRSRRVLCRIGCGPHGPAPLPVHLSSVAMTALAIAVSDFGTSRASWRLRSGPPRIRRSNVLR
jgi:hypothetical protein